MTKQEQSFEMARRLKSLREESKLSHDKLKAALFEQFGIKISRDSLMSYEIQAEPHSKIKNGKYPNLNMGVEYLNAFAQFYGVSADYLLGLTDIPNSDTTMQAVHGIIGLSVGAIAKLHEINKENHKTAFLDIISLLIENPNAEYFLAEIGDLLSCDIEGTGGELITVDVIPMTVRRDELIQTLLHTKFIENIHFIAESYKQQFKKSPAKRRMECKNGGKH